MVKAPDNFNKKNYPGATEMGNAMKSTMDKSVMAFPKNGLEAETRGNKSQNMVNKNVLSVQEVNLTGNNKGK